MLKKDKERLLKIASHYKKQSVKNYAEKGEQLDLNLFGNLKLIFGLKPTQAIEYFKKKKPELTEKYYDLWREEHDKAFTIAGIGSLNLLVDIQGKLQQALEQGMTYKQFEEEFESSVLKKMGWTSDDKDIPPYRIQNIFRTNVGGSYCAGRWQNIEDNKESRRYLKYHSLEDNAVRPAHAEMNGKVFPVDDPIWNTHAPKNGYNCRCWLQALSERDIKRKGLIVEDSSDGQIIEKEITLNKKEDIKAKITVYIDPKGNHIPIDPGFDYNPGKKNYIPDTKKYPPKLKPIAEKLIKNIPVEVKEVKSAWKDGKLTPEDIEGWRKLEEGDSEEVKTEKQYNNMKVYSEEMRKTLESEFNLKDEIPIPNGFIYCKTEEEFNKLKANDKKWSAFYSRDDSIVYSPDVIKGNWTNSGFTNTPIHEILHGIGKMGYIQWDGEEERQRFLEEGLTELLSRKITSKMIKDFDINRLTRGSYQEYISPMLFQLVVEYGNKDIIYDKLKQVRVGRVLIKDDPNLETHSKNYQASWTFEKNTIKYTTYGEMKQKDFEEMLKKISKYDIMKGEKEIQGSIKKFLKYTKEQKKQISDQLKESKENIEYLKRKGIDPSVIEDYKKQVEQDKKDFKNKQLFASPARYQVEGALIKWFLRE